MTPVPPPTPQDLLLHWLKALKAPEVLVIAVTCIFSLIAWYSLIRASAKTSSIASAAHARASWHWQDTLRVSLTVLVAQAAGSWGVAVIGQAVTLMAHHAQTPIWQFIQSQATWSGALKGITRLESLILEREWWWWAMVLYLVFLFWDLVTMGDSDSFVKKLLDAVGILPLASLMILSLIGTIAGAVQFISPRDLVSSTYLIPSLFSLGSVTLLIYSVGLVDDRR